MKINGPNGKSVIKPRKIEMESICSTVLPFCVAGIDPPFLQRTLQIYRTFNNAFFKKYQCLVLVFSLFTAYLFETTDLTFAHKSIFTWDSGERGLLALQSWGHLGVLPPHWSLDNIRTNGSISWSHVRP